MEVIHKVINYSRPDVIDIYPFSDAHLGSPGCSETHLRKKILECANKGNMAYALGVGDWADSITKNDKRFTGNCLADWVERTNIIESQRKKIKSIFSPITEQGQWLGIGAGNHEETIHDNHSDDLIRNVCNDLNVPYAGYHAFYNLEFRRCGKKTHNLIIHAWHGSGAAQTEGARLNRLVRLVNDFEADIYLMGHLHAKTTHETNRLGLVNGRITAVPVKASITGAWLKAYEQPEDGKSSDPSYVEKKGYKPAVIGCPIIRIRPDNYCNPYEEQFEIIS